MPQKQVIFFNFRKLIDHNDTLQNRYAWDDEKYAILLDCLANTAKQYNDESFHEPLYIEMHALLWNFSSLREYVMKEREHLYPDEPFEHRVFLDLTEYMREEDCINKNWVRTMADGSTQQLEYQTLHTCFFMSSTKGIRK